MIIRFALYIIVCLGSMPVWSAEQTTQLTPTQKEVVSKYNELVRSYPRDHKDSFLFMKLTVTLDGKGDLTEQISRQELKDRQNYDIFSFDVIHGSTSQIVRARRTWKDDLLDELFTIEKDRAPKTNIPYFCYALKKVDLIIKFDNPDDEEAAKVVAYCKDSINKIIAPLLKKGDTTPIHVAVLKGNHYGNCKYVKLYIGKKSKSADDKQTVSDTYLVLDVSVYDHI